MANAGNGIWVTGVESKMGIKVSTTCELTLGDPVVRVQHAQHVALALHAPHRKSDGQ